MCCGALRVLMHLATWGMVLECLEHTDIGMGVIAPPVLIATVAVASLGLLATVAWIVLLLAPGLAGGKRSASCVPSPRLWW